MILQHYRSSEFCRIPEDFFVTDGKQIMILNILKLAAILLAWKWLFRNNELLRIAK
jgi:hypothetical protein